MAKNQNVPWTNEELLNVAKAQKQVIVAFLIMTGLSISTHSLKNCNLNETTLAIIAGIIVLFFICSTIYLIFWTYKLAAALRLHWVTSSICAFSMLIKLISLVVVLIIVLYATQILRNNGIKVGLIGADWADLEKLKTKSEQNQNQNQNQNQTPIIS